MIKYGEQTEIYCFHWCVCVCVCPCTEEAILFALNRVYKVTCVKTAATVLIKRKLEG